MRRVLLDSMRQCGVSEEWCTMIESATALQKHHATAATRPKGRRCEKPFGKSQSADQSDGHMVEITQGSLELGAWD